MNYIFDFLILCFLGIILTVFTFLINKRAGMSKNEKLLFGYGIGTIYTCFMIEFLTNAYSPSLKIMMSLYIFALYNFSRFIISLIFIAKKSNN